MNAKDIADSIHKDPSKSPPNSLTKFAESFGGMDILASGLLSGNDFVINECCLIWDQLFKLSDSPELLLSPDMFSFLIDSVSKNPSSAVRGCAARGIFRCSQKATLSDSTIIKCPLLPHIQTLIMILPQLLRDGVEVQQQIQNAFVSVSESGTEEFYKLLCADELLNQLFSTTTHASSSSSKNDNKEIARVSLVSFDMYVHICEKGKSIPDYFIQKIYPYFQDYIKTTVSPQFEEEDPLLLNNIIEILKNFIHCACFSPMLFPEKIPSDFSKNHILSSLVSIIQSQICGPSAFEAISEIIRLHPIFVLNFENGSTILSCINSLTPPSTASPATFYPTIPVASAECCSLFLQNRSFADFIDKVDTFPLPDSTFSEFEECRKKISTTPSFSSPSSQPLPSLDSHSALLAFHLGSLPRLIRGVTHAGLASAALSAIISLSAAASPYTPLCYAALECIVLGMSPLFWMIKGPGQIPDEVIRKLVLKCIESLAKYEWFIDDFGKSAEAVQYVTDPTTMIDREGVVLQSSVSKALFNSPFSSKIPEIVQKKLAYRSQSTIGKGDAVPKVAVDELTEL
ncbi:uncharacterized protein MONOS_10766 [Monocercomonoides exilis]|uniref:uncharacterized protein n=1 Tax=Monocercomonoides exilis TaxID=2049356 RepID=UPI00355AB653|nr:hypothetical protein MONOS_10766 [Monocercomonoides exilis]|eukprot:MONOS_10766.1-p1 / transcript=MONOS_10766.1 / gene=MONOS_10766 / organism=Monocercomonoides_exilis_PA203 / gene_product=unspecified product / transcript_product=unspecified product / location=Mono_scaffold00503:27992-30453(+) / protein_length=571 / sequence_SO=supercontig / SO=protein_coding / is_pseudo=false